MLLFVGVVGYSAKKFDVNLATEYLKDAFTHVSHLVDIYHQENIYIVSGYTNMGIPALAYSLAESFDWKTIGLACKKAFENGCYPVDKQIIVGDNWGDESDTLINLCDIMIRVGGGPQAMKEIKMFKERYPDKLVIEYDLEAI